MGKGTFWTKVQVSINQFSNSARHRLP